MDLIKKVFTTPVKSEERRQVSPDTASTSAPPEATAEKRRSTEVPMTDAAIAALQGFTFNPNNPSTPINLGAPANGQPNGVEPQCIMFSPPAPQTREPITT